MAFLESIMRWLFEIDRTPEGEELDRKKLKYMRGLLWSKIKHNPKKRCHIVALGRCYHYQRVGVPYKLCMGKYKDEGHAWCEYFEDEVWRIDDPSQGIRGWERRKVKMYSQDAVETVPDFRK